MNDVTTPIELLFEQIDTDKHTQRPEENHTPIPNLSTLDTTTLKLQNAWNLRVVTGMPNRQPTKLGPISNLQ